MLNYLLFDIQSELIWFLLFLVATQIAALALDHWLGEPKKFHPLVGFGNFLAGIERGLNRVSRQSQKISGRFFGFMAWTILVLPITLLCFYFCVWLYNLPGVGIALFWFFNLLVLYLAIGLKSLAQHATYVAEPMMQGDLVEGRAKVAWLVSRQTQDMDASEINKACLESVLENGNDAVVGALFWFAVAGAPGVLLYRLVNTLDASWGYRSERYLYFGWWSARADDWMNFLPARICALAYSLCGNWKNAIASWRETNIWRRVHGRGFASPNAGPVMASGAGALQLQLGGTAIYHGVRKLKPELGSGREPMASDISLGVSLVYRAVALVLILQALLFLLSLFGFAILGAA